MAVFLTLFAKMLPLMCMLFLGYLAQRLLSIPKEAIARLLIYVIAPVVVFHGVLVAELTPQLLTLPLLFFILASGFGLGSYFLNKKLWKAHPVSNLLAFMAGTGNTGYFGLPLILLFFGESGFSLAVLLTLGMVLYENSLGYYLTMRGRFTGRDAVKKLLKIPTLYAFILALVLNLWGVESMPVSISEPFRGAYTLLGMMIVGMGMSGVSRKDLDFKLVSSAFFTKFLLWPVVVAGVIFLDKNLLHFYDAAVHEVMFLLSIVPIAANTVAFASELDLFPRKAAAMVVLSNVFALVYIPALLLVFG